MKQLEAVRPMEQHLQILPLLQENLRMDLRFVRIVLVHRTRGNSKRPTLMLQLLVAELLKLSLIFFVFLAFIDD